MSAEAEKMAEAFVTEKICYGGLEYSLGGKTYDNCMESFLAGFSAGREHERKRAEALIQTMLDVRSELSSPHWADRHWCIAQICAALSAYEKDGESPQMG